MLELSRFPCLFVCSPVHLLSFSLLPLFFSLPFFPPSPRPCDIPLLYSPSSTPSSILSLACILVSHFFSITLSTCKSTKKYHIRHNQKKRNRRIHNTPQSRSERPCAPPLFTRFQQQRPRSRSKPRVFALNGFPFVTLCSSFACARRGLRWNPSGAATPPPSPGGRARWICLQVSRRALNVLNELPVTSACLLVFRLVCLSLRVCLCPDSLPL